MTYAAKTMNGSALDGATWLARVRAPIRPLRVPARRPIVDALVDEHATAATTDPELYALLAIAEGASPEYQARALFALLAASRRDASATAVAIADRVIATLTAVLPADDVLTVFLALRKRRANHKHTARTILRWANAIIIGFSVQAEVPARRLAEKEGVDIRLYEIIYRMTEDIEKALKGMLEPEVKEVVIGRAQVLQVFTASKFGRVAGCRVTDGELRRNAKVKLFRGTDLVYEGDMGSLRHEKDDVKEIKQGYECGVGFKGFSDIQPGDQLICYVLEKS